ARVSVHVAREVAAVPRRDLAIEHGGDRGAVGGFEPRDARRAGRAAAERADRGDGRGKGDRESDRERGEPHGPKRTASAGGAAHHGRGDGARPAGCRTFASCPPDGSAWSAAAMSWSS